MRNLIVILVVIFALVSCDSNQFFDSYKTIPSKWDKNDSVVFSFKNPDTLKQYNLFLNIRNTNDYEFSNLFLITTLESPDKITVVDTLEYLMAKPNGEWLGQGSNVIENKLWYKERYSFKSNGDYKVTVRHAMRKQGSAKGVEHLNGITEVGFRIENNNK